MLEFKFIENDSDEEVIRFVNSLVKNVSNNIDTSSKIKLLNYYYENKKNFPNLNIPNIGLIEDKNDVNLDNRIFFN